ncbi:MAG: GTP cyclohydrolase I FolE2 [Actinobacteria bacterium]|nr:GTP cyclohydrolase I FolE2 [Actinomycetota bacterium]
MKHPGVPHPSALHDTHAQPDDRNVVLERVGVTRLAIPIRILERSGGVQHVSALAGIFAELQPALKGAHLSRLVELMTGCANQPIGREEIFKMLQDARARLDSPCAEINLHFGFFVPRHAPVTRLVAPQRYRCLLRGRSDARGYVFQLGLQVPITTLCPCSKSISDRGAHSQRAFVSVGLTYTRAAPIWFEDLIDLVEEQGSAPVVPILKRLDEKFVSEHAYNNPKFVEDVVRDVIIAIKQGVDGFDSLSVECESQESIHAHNAYAMTRESAVATDDDYFDALRWSGSFGASSAPLP